MIASRALPALIVLAMLTTAGCGDLDPARPPVDEQPGPESDLRPADDLESHCYRWPEAAFTRSRYADTAISIAPGDRAFDFTLEDTDGVSHTLAELLATRPVALILGSFT